MSLEEFGLVEDSMADKLSDLCADVIPHLEGANGASLRSAYHLDVQHKLAQAMCVYFAGSPAVSYKLTQDGLALLCGEVPVHFPKGRTLVVTQEGNDFSAKL